jgi:hypothetical protein
MNKKTGSQRRPNRRKNARSRNDAPTEAVPRPSPSTKPEPTEPAVSQMPKRKIGALVKASTASLIVLLIVFVVMGARLFTWEDGSRQSSFRIFAGPIHGEAYTHSIGSTLLVNVVDHVDFWQRIGSMREPLILVRMSVLIDPKAKAQDHSWRVQLPEGTTATRVMDKLQVTTAGGQIGFDWDPEKTAWSTVPPQTSSMTVQPPIYWTEDKSNGQAGYGYALVWLELKVRSLRVGNVLEDGALAELWQLTWSPSSPEGLQQIWGTADGEFPSLDPINPLGPVNFPKRDVSYQMTVCPTCLPINSYADAHALDKSEYAVAGNFGESKTLSFTTPSYPWSWISVVYWGRPPRQWDP